MDNREISNKLISGCKKYYQHLEEMQKFFPTKYGTNVNAVLNVSGSTTPNVFELTVAQKIINPDMCAVYVDHQKCDHISIRQCNFRSGRKSVLIEVNEPFLEEFIYISPNRLEIISDMKFLIEALGNFYTTHKLNLLPPSPCTLLELPQGLITPMSEEQREAYHGVFAHPVSYVWGAPGTGKTNMVLSRCILRYVMNDKRIFLLAPTNNAIEQVLRGILPVMKNAGISLHTVYRLGTASEDFAKQYPEVVGDRDLEAAVQELNAEINAVKERIAKCSQLEIAYICAKERNDFLHKACEVVVPLLTTISEQIDNISQAQAESDEKAAAYEAIAQQKHSLEDTYASQSQRVSDCQRLIDNNIQTLNRWRYYFWKKRKRELLDAENAKLYMALSSLKDEVTKTEAELSKVLQPYHTALAARSAAEAVRTAICNELAILEQRLSTLLSSTPRMQKLVPRQPLTREGNSQCIDNIHHLVADSDRHVADAYNAYIGEDAAALQRHLAQLEAEAKTIGQSEKVKQKKNALVLAGTIEAALHSLSVPDDEPPVAHVFIDEAGYTSLARGLSAFVCNCPVSFFGEHLQMPPICEMEKIQPDTMAVSLFSLSVAHYPATLHNSMADIYENFYKLEKPPTTSDAMPILPLTYTYRFSDILAQLLSKHFYPLDFHGDSNAPFEVIVLDAPRRPGKNKRTNPAELQAISEYLSTAQETDYAILTPYRNQQAFLRDAGFDKDSVLTVHRSQGREWDTVIFSVVDSYDKFYVDSNHPIGQQVLNTAISRARKRLIVACDASYWSTQHGQFIQALLQLAKNA